MKLQRVLRLIAILAVNCNAAINYYEVIGLKPDAPRVDIRARCEGLRAQRPMAEHVEEACTTLLNPESRVVHDSEVRELEASKKELEESTKKLIEMGEKAAEISHYQLLMLPEKADSTKISEQCTSEKKKSLQDQLKDIPDIAKKIENACTVLLDPTQKTKYDEQIEEEGELGGIKKRILGVAKDKDALLVKLIGTALSKIPIPDLALSVFNQNLAMKNLRFITAPTGVGIRTGLGFMGSMSFNQFLVEARVYAVEDTNRKMQYSLAIKLPEHYKISSLFPDFKKLDDLSLPRAKFVLSTFAYFDPEGHSIKPGFNFVSFLDLAGPLKLLADLKDRAKSLRSIVVRSDIIRFQGIIPRDIKKAEFSSTIPLYLGIDFTKIPHMPKSITKIFKEITTDEFVLVLTAPPKVSFTIESGIRLVLGTQPNPIRLSAFGIIEPSNFSLGMRMRNLLELNWVALGNAGIQLDFDSNLMPAAAALGVPFTGIGIHGELDVGKPGESRAIFKIGGGARVKSTGIPDLVFDVSADNLRFGDLINLLIKTAGKGKVFKPFSAVNIPVMNLDHVRGYLALEDTKIAGKTYSAGFSLEVDADMFGYQGGFSFELLHTALTARGSGYLSNIDVKIKDKPIFRLTGPQFVTKAGKQVEGPAMDFNFGLKNVDMGSFGMRGTFEIPAINLKEAVIFRWSGWNLDANIESNYLGFGAIFGVNINLKAGTQPQAIALPGSEEEKPKTDEQLNKEREAKKEKWRQMRLRFGFKGEFAKFLSDNIKPFLDDLRANASQRLEALNEEVGKLSSKLNEFSKKTDVSMESEIATVRSNVSAIKKKIENLQREREATKNLIKKGKITVEIGKLRAGLAAKEIYLNALLKPAEKVVVGTTALLSKVTESLHKAKLLKTAVEKTLDGLSKATTAIAKGLSIVNLKEAIGELSTSELAVGKMPKLKSLILEANIPGLPHAEVRFTDIQFDFKAPVKSVKDIAKKVAQALSTIKF